MTDAGKRVRVILRWVQVKDTLDPFFKNKGQFRFWSKVTSGGQTQELKFPEKGHYSISDHPRFSKIDKLDKVLWDGEVGDTMRVEVFGEEVDRWSKNDPLDNYSRFFDGPVESWVGRHQPGDEGSADPENMKLWRLGYDVEMA
jgi:hypothetical protein